MLSHLLECIGAAYAGGAAKRHTAAIARYHRIQASPGYRAAANWILHTLQNAGVSASIETYPANLQATFWSLASFQEWACEEATLEWVKGERVERLCDYRSSAVSVIQRSIAVCGEFSVVDVGAGRPEDYEGVDVAGKLVLSRAHVMQTYREAVLQRDAAGILFDDIGATAPGRSRHDLPDARQYASFWWGDDDPRGWGFVLTPRQGDAIRAALQAGDEVVMRAHIRASLYDGEFENVVAQIPGTEEGEVLAMAHLCHPQDFANDNASGAAALLETAITLQELIASGVLPPPKRTLTFLWMPEMTGTFAWLAAHEERIPHIVAGINLDMVGEDPDKTGSVFLIDSPPAASASFTVALLSRLRDTLLDKAYSFQQVQTPLSLIRTQTIPFSGGSDHMVTSDPTVGIPTPMLIQWPDRHYHTTADAMAMVSERSLWLAGVLAGSYLYWLAQAGRKEAQWLGWEMLHQYERDVADEVGSALADWTSLAPEEQARALNALEARLTFRHERMGAALASLERLAPLEHELYLLLGELNDLTESIRARLQRQTRSQYGIDAWTDEDAWAIRAQNIIPRRRYRGPIMEMGFPNRVLSLDDEGGNAWRALAQQPYWRLLRAIAEYWTDGHRSLAEIADLVALETGFHVGPAIEQYFTLLAQVGLMDLQQR